MNSNKITSFSSFLLLLSLAIGVGITIWIIGFSMLNPTRTDLLLQGDLGVHYLGWAFFRYEEWSFPIGHVSDFFYPQGANVGYTDSIPLMAILLKPFHAILPVNFQYIGWWFVLMMGLQVIFSWKIMGALGINHPLTKFLSTLMLSLSPIWFFRMVHPALCSHFLILGSIWVYISSLQKENIRSPLINQAVLVLLSAYIHPYMAAIVLALTWVWIGRLWLMDKKIRWFEVPIAMGISAGLLLLNWWVIGYFEISGENMGREGLGVYSMNVNALINPTQGQSLFLPDLPHIYEQYEGFSYLGIGGLLLFMLGIVFIFRKGKEVLNRGLGFLWIGGILLTIFALSPIVYAGNVRILMYDLPESAAIFRATGRFVWPLYYLIILSFLGILNNSVVRKSVLAGLLAGIVLVQLLDTHVTWKSRQFFGEKVTKNNLKINPELWNPILQASNKLMFWPPVMHGPTDYLSISWIAASNHMPVTLGYIARVNKVEREAFVDSFRVSLENGRFDPEALYVFDPGNAVDMSASMEKVRLQQMDDFVLAISEQANDSLKAAFEQVARKHGNPTPIGENMAQFLERHKEHICLMSVLDEGSYRLSDEVKSYLRGRGSMIDSLQFRSAYLGLMVNNQMLWEQFPPGDRIELSFPEGKRLDTLEIKKNLRLVSSNPAGGYVSSIEIDGQEFSPKARGFNIVVLDKDWKIVETTYFDTFETSFHFHL